MHKISAWVAVDAGPTLIAGIYGMNFETRPELRWPGVVAGCDLGPHPASTRWATLSRDAKHGG